MGYVAAMYHGHVLLHTVMSLEPNWADEAGNIGGTLAHVSICRFFLVKSQLTGDAGEGGWHMMLPILMLHELCKTWTGCCAGHGFPFV